MLEVPDTGNADTSSIISTDDSELASKSPQTTPIFSPEYEGKHASQNLPALSEEVLSPSERQESSVEIADFIEDSDHHRQHPPSLRKSHSTPIYKERKEKKSSPSPKRPRSARLHRLSHSSKRIPPNQSHHHEFHRSRRRKRSVNDEVYPPTPPFDFDLSPNSKLGNHSDEENISENLSDLSQVPDTRPLPNPSSVRSSRNRLDRRHSTNTHSSSSRRLQRAWSTRRLATYVDDIHIDHHDLASPHYRRSTMGQLQDQLTELNLQLKKKGEMNSYLEAQNSALRDELRESGNTLREYTASLECITTENARLGSENEVLMANIQDIRQKECGKLQEKLKLLETENTQLKNETYDPDDYTNELFNLRYENKNQRKQIDELTKQLVVLTQNNTQQEQEISFLKAALSNRQTLPANLPAHLQDLVMERDELEIALRESRQRISDLERGTANGELIIGKPPEEADAENPMQLAWKKLGTTLVQNQDLKTNLEAKKEESETLRIQLAELSSENKQLNREIEKTRRMSVNIIEEFAYTMQNQMRDSEDTFSSDDGESSDVDIIPNTSFYSAI